MGDGPRLQGRAAQVDQVLAALADPATHGVVPRGAAGIGKSRLAAEVLGRAAAQGCSVVEVRATETSRNVPFGAFAALVPALGSEANPLTAATGPVLVHRARGTRLVLFVDDAHWLDDVSAALVRHLADHHDVFVVLTMRSGERTSDAVRALWRERSLRTVNVGALDDHDVVAMAEALLGGVLDANAAADLAALAAGNALAAVELVRGGQEAGLWQLAGGRWVADDLTRSAAVTELVAARLDRLADDERLLVELIAFGDPVPLDAFTGDDLALLNELEQRAIVTVRGAGSRPEVWVAHPLHGELIRRDVSALRRRSVLADLVGRMAFASDDADRLRVALWSLEAGIAPDAGQLAQAARRAFVTHRFDLAARLLRAVPGDRRTDMQVYKFLIAAWWVGDRAMFDEALAGARLRLPGSALDGRLQEFERLSADMRAGPGGDDLGTAPAARTSANTLTRMPPDQLAARFVAAGLDRIPDRDDPERIQGSRTLTALALALTHAGRPEQARPFADAAFELHSESWDADPLALAPTHPVAARRRA